jgi:tetratricopeptide (TPR) repeat protein
VVGGDLTGSPWRSRIFDLRVDDHPEPLPELRRLINVARAYRYFSEASEIGRDETLGAERFEVANRKFEQAMRYSQDMPGNAEIAFWWAAQLASSGRWDEATPLFREAFAADPIWRDLVPRLPRVGRLPDSLEVIERIRGIGT